MTWWNFHAAPTTAVNAPWPQACRAALQCALHGLDGWSAWRIGLSGAFAPRAISIIPIVGLMHIIIGPRDLAQNIINPIDEAKTGADEKLAVTIDDGPDKMRIDVGW